VPGKHAPESPASFILSVSRAAAGALVVLGVVAVIAVAATGSNKKPTAKSSITPTVTRTTHPPSSSPSTQSSVSLTPTASASTAPKVTVNVLNGTTRTGIARALATKLTAEHYLVKTVATEPKHQTVTTIYYRPGGQAAAEALLAAHQELGKVAPAISSTPTNAELTVILGDDYNAA
jgi:maltose-binding protein MalE